MITKAQFVGVIRGLLGLIGLPQHQYRVLARKKIKEGGGFEIKGYLWFF